MERFKLRTRNIMNIRRYSSRHDIDSSNVVNKNTSNSKEGLSENRKTKSEKSEESYNRKNQRFVEQES